MRYDDNHKERTRARVLAEAAAAIRGKGVERVGVAEVMAGAGLTHGGFYAHFKSKDDLLTEAISYMFDDAYASFLRHTEGRAPADALSHYIDAYLATSHRDDREGVGGGDRKSTRLNSSHANISYAVFCLKKKK